MWDQVQTEFAGDETTNFGPRKETGTALYQVDTIATISTQNQAAAEVRQLVSATLGELVCVGVDHHLSIFKESQHEVTISFDHLVEDCAWSPDGSLLLVVDAGGKLSFFSADSLQSLFSFFLLPTGSSDGKAFRRIVFRNNEDSETCDLVLLSAKGLLFVVSGFKPSSFLQGFSSLDKVQEHLQFRKVQTADVHTDSTWDAVPLGNGSVITVGAGDNILAVWRWQDNCLSLDDSVGDMLEAECGIISAKLASNDKTLYTLDEKNQVIVWLVPELVMLSCVTIPLTGTQTHIFDFLLLETQGTQLHSLAGTRLVLLLSDMLSSTLQIRDMEQATEVYSLQLGSPTCLSRCAHTQESLYVGEGTPALGDSDKVSTVRLRCLTETNPETRLQRILYKKRFEEALQFAHLFNLDTELVYTAQMNQLLEQLSPWNVVCYDDQQVAAMLDQLWTSVNHVKDSQLVAENCMRAALPSFAHTCKLLQLCQSKLSSAVTDLNERQQNLQTKVLELQNRLVTYKLAFGAQTYSANSWMQFQQANLLHMVCGSVVQQQPHIALLVWRRHCDEWGAEMSMEVVQHFLQAVAEGLQGGKILGWLQDNLLPYVARVLPQAMGSVIQWAVETAASMEQAEKAGWPKNAINFLEVINSSVTSLTDVNFTSKDTAVEMATKTQIEVFEVLKPLRNTLSTLYQLQDLLTYDLRLSIKQFQQETKETLAFRMLDQVVMPELFKPTLEKYITPYIRANQLDQDHIFATYIKDLLERTGHVRSYMGQSAWEDKVLAIVSFICNPKDKCCAVLNVIKHAPLPWSPDIRQLVENGLKIQHPLVREIQEQKKIAGVRQLMLDYDLKSCQVPGQHNAERLAVCFIEKDKTNSLHDALRVLREYNITRPSSVSHIYLRHAAILIRTDRVLDYLRLLRSMDADQARRLGERVVSLAEVTLDTSVPQPKLKEVMDIHSQRLTLAAVLTLQYLMSMTTANSLEQKELKIQLDMFSKLCALQREYKMILSMKEYSDEVNRNKVFASFTENFLRNNTPFQGAGRLTCLYRLAELLQLKQETVQGELAIVEARVGNLDAALFLCRELLQGESSEEMALVLQRVVKTFLQLHGQGYFDMGNDSDHTVKSVNQDNCRQLPFVLEKMANQAVVMCDASMITVCLELSKATRLWRQVVSKCETTDVPLLQLDSMETKPTSRDPLQVYNFDTVYTDKALVMNSAIAPPLATASLTTTFAGLQGEDEKDEEEASAAMAEDTLSRLQPVLSHLRENSHLQLSLRFLIVTMSAVHLQYDMGCPQGPEINARLEIQRSSTLNAEKKAVKLFHSILSDLVPKVLSAHHVDHKMALAYLLAAPRKVSIDCLMKSIASCNFNFRKLGAIANVGVALGNLLRETKMISTCQELQISAGWGVRLGKLKISFKEAFQGGPLAKQAVIAAMAHCDKVDIDMLVHFSTDFSLDVDGSLLVFLEELLKTSPDSRQLDRARTVVTTVKARNSSDFLFRKLKSIYKQISPYNYEVIEFLLEEINRLDSSPLYEKGLKLLSYLKIYSRRNPPSDYEVSKVTTTLGKEEEYGEMGDMMPKEAATRVPLHLLLEEPWKIITGELDADTVPHWLQIVQPLELSTDEVYILTVQNIIRRHLSHNMSTPITEDTHTSRSRPTSPQNWTVSESSLHVLEGVQRLLSCVKSCEMALACANWVVRELPMGGDKVLVLQGCVAFAQRWYQACEESSAKKEKARVATSKFQKVLRKVLTEQALYVNGLTEPQLLQLVSAPLDLITQLTEHSAVVADVGRTGPMPDIYSTVHRVCEVNDLDIGQVLVTAVGKWLLSSDSTQDGDTTMNFSFSNLKMTEDALESEQNDNIKRVLYFLHRGPRQKLVQFLIDTVSTGQAENTSHLGRMQCLYCLVQTAQDSDLQTMGLSCHSIREMLRVSCYLSQLEELHIQLSAQSFSDCNKQGLVKAIWRNKHQKSAVRLTADLCLDYKLYDRQQWAAILQQMVTLNMLAELERVLQRLRCVAGLLSLPVFTTAWQAVLLAPLSKATLPLTDQQTREYLHVLNLLHRCPVSCQLDLSALGQHFKRLELSVCAVSCMLMDPAISHNDIQDLLSQDPGKLADETYRLTGLGLNLSAATQVREMIFQNLLEAGDFHGVSQQALQDFVRFIIQQDNIDGCLCYAVSNNLVSQAESLVELYLECYPERYDEVVEWCNSEGHQLVSPLQAYLQMKELM